jgi:hypothetical protein
MPRSDRKPGDDVRDGVDRRVDGGVDTRSRLGLERFDMDGRVEVERPLGGERCVSGAE